MEIVNGTLLAPRVAPADAVQPDTVARNCPSDTMTPSDAQLVMMFSSNCAMLMAATAVVQSTARNSSSVTSTSVLDAGHEG